MAAEYGWTQDYILDHIYPDDYLYYQEVITQRKYTNYLMDLAIVHNPNSEKPEELFEALKMNTGSSYLDAVEPDKAALENLQGLLSPNMKKII